MTLAERLPSLDDKELANLRANALRLQAGGGKRGVEAEAFLPLIETELAERIARKPARTRKRAAAAGAA